MGNRNKRLTPWQLFSCMATKWSEADAGTLTASVAYYAAISLFPAMLILTSGVGCFLKWTNYGHDAESYILSVVSDQVSPALSENLRVALAQVANHATIGGPLGFGILLVTALAMFSQFERAFARIWHVPSSESVSMWRFAVDILTRRLRAFGLLLGLGLAIVTVFVSTMALDTVRSYADPHWQQFVWVWWSLELLTAVALNAVVFAMLYRLAPRVRPAWRQAIRGGVLAAAIWEFGRQMLTSLIIGQRYTSAYGVIGALMAIMLWSYYAAAVVFIGAIFIRVEQETAELKNPDQADQQRGHPKRRIQALDIVFAACLLYTGSFLMSVYAKSYRLPQYAPEDPRSHVVLFSSDPSLQRLARLIYLPLIEGLPHGRYFPEGSETTQMLEEAWSVHRSRGDDSNAAQLPEQIRR